MRQSFAKLSNRTDMKGTEQFQAVIKDYLDKRAQEDKLFRAKYETTTRTIEDVVTYIIGEVQKSGRCGFADEEIYSLATHCIYEQQLEIGERIACDVVVNTHIELTDEEKAEQKALALKRYQDEEISKIRQRNNKPKTVKRQETEKPQYSLFDMFEP